MIVIKEILSVKINRKKFFGGWILLAFFISLLNATYENIVLFGWILFLFLWLFLFNARCNDIGLTAGEKIGALAVSFIPIVGLFPFLYLLFTKGKDYKQSLKSFVYKTTSQ